MNTSYSYNSSGLMSSEAQNGGEINHTIGIDQWIIGNSVYDLDSMGRVKRKNGRIFEYGSSGRISHVSGTGINEADYFYDEENMPLLKVLKFGRIIVFLDDNSYVNDYFLEPIKIGFRVVGYFKNGIFVSTSQDQLNTNVINENGDVNLANPFGERSNHTEVSEILDFTLKGFDQELSALRVAQRYYDPEVKLFFSPDYYFLESPEEILNHPIEGNLYSYAGNDPTNYFDPLGLWGVRFSVGYGASAVVGIEYSRSWAITFSKEHGLQFGIVNELASSVGYQGGADINGSISLSNAKQISDYKGYSVGGKLQVATGVGGGASFTKGINKDGSFNNSKEVSVSITGGAKIEAAGIGSFAKAQKEEVEWIKRMNSFLSSMGLIENKKEDAVDKNINKVGDKNDWRTPL